MAWRRLRQAPRTFRLDRVAQVSATGKAIAPRSLDALLAEIPLDLAEPTLPQGHPSRCWALNPDSTVSTAGASVGSDLPLDPDERTRRNR